MVIVDTSVWIPYFRDPDSKEKHVMDRLIDRDMLAVAGIVVMELIQGCRTRVDMDEMKDTLLALPYLETSQDTWVRAGETSSVLRRRGITLPFTDLVLAVLSIEHLCEVYTLDPHFRKIPEVRLYSPSSA